MQLNLKRGQGQRQVARPVVADCEKEPGRQKEFLEEDIVKTEFSLVTKVNTLCVSSATKLGSSHRTGRYCFSNLSF